MRIEKPTFEELMSIDIESHFSKFRYRGGSEGEFIHQQFNNNGPHIRAGIEHYRLLAWFSQKFNGAKFIEIGTQTGLGMVSLAFNPNNRVISYDIVKHNPMHITPGNCETRICEYNFSQYDVVAESSFIFYDGGHHGQQERVFFNTLVSMNWKGVLFLDDIHLNEEMESFWRDISLPKEDWTDIGHGYINAGTGVVFFE